MRCFCLKIQILNEFFKLNFVLFIGKTDKKLEGRGGEEKKESSKYKKV